MSMVLEHELKSKREARFNCRTTSNNLQILRKATVR